MTHGTDEPMPVVKQAWRDLDDNQKLFYKARAKAKPQQPSSSGGKPDKRLPFDMGDESTPLSVSAFEEAARIC